MVLPYLNCRLMNVRCLMGVPQTPSTTEGQGQASTHLYPQELQLKLYQAFIFSIPILFSIILFLLFYLFYLKRRASSFSSPHHILPTTINNHPSPTTYLSNSPCRLNLTLQFLDKLPKILFDEELRARGSQCCVCLGEFEMKEELLQIPYCRHVFHIDCISHWLQSNSTCPLCRCSIIPTTKFLNLQTPPVVPQPLQPHTSNSNTPLPQPQDGVAASSNTNHFSRE